MPLTYVRADAGLGEAGLAVLAGSLMRCTDLREIIVASTLRCWLLTLTVTRARRAVDNPLGDGGAVVLAEVVKASSSLRRLMLRGTDSWCGRGVFNLISTSTRV